MSTISTRLQENTVDENKPTEYKIGKKQLSFLDVLIKLYKNKKISYQGMKEEVDTFMGAGAETISTSMTFTLFFLSLNEKYMKRAQAEVDAVIEIEDNSDSINEHLTKFSVLNPDIEKLGFLEACIRESLRLFPPCHRISRAVNKGFMNSVEYTVHAPICFKETQESGKKRILLIH